MLNFGDSPSERETNQNPGLTLKITGVPFIVSVIVTLLLNELVYPLNEVSDEELLPLALRKENRPPEAWVTEVECPSEDQSEEL